MTAKTTTKTFKEKAFLVHGNKYDYSLVEYVGAYSPVKIICGKHGVFTQVAQDHLTGRGCNACKYDSVRLTRTHFLERVAEVHKYKYTYPDLKFKSTKDTIKVVCPIHGEFKQRVNSHLHGVGCIKCGNEASREKRTLTTEEFIKRSKEVHGDKYDYSRSAYKKQIENVEIICSEHGVFNQKPLGHLSGQGCPECNNPFWGINTYFKKNPHMVNHPSVLYIALIEDKDEKFIKVGHTKKSFEKRFPNEKAGKYKIKPLVQHFSGLFECVMLESKTHKSFKVCSYKPTRKFGGSTECYRYEDLEKIKSFIREEIK